MGYVMKQADVYGLAQMLNAETIQRGDELFFKYCPYCHGGNHDKETFSVNLVTGTYKCFRASCDAHGHFVEMARDFNYPLEFENSKPKKYRQLVQKPITVRDKAIGYMASRGISAEITRKYKITTWENKDNILAFPFFDENNVMVSAKYRKTDFDKSKDKNKEWFEKDTEPILFGMMQCNLDNKMLVITEGQIDSLSVAESGIENAVSVPNGANGFTWIQNCYDWIDKNFDTITVFGDCEKGKITLIDGICQYFPKKKIKLVRKEDYLGEKDANDILRKYGKDAVKKCVENAEEVKPKAIKKLSDVKAVDLVGMEHIRTGIYELDKRIGGLYMGQVAVLTGKRGEGKSTLASQIMANALNQTDPSGEPYNIFAYSGELPDYHFKSWIDKQIAGADNLTAKYNEYGDVTYEIAPNITETINNWYENRAYIFDNTVVNSELDVSTAENKVTLLETIEQAITHYNTKLILIDNLMTALDYEPSDDLYRAQSNFVNKVKSIAVKYNVAVILIAHPRKSQFGEKSLGNESISGSADITNRVDLVITYSKNTESDNEDYQSVIGVTKNRLTGRLVEKLKVRYDDATKRIGCNNSEWDKVYKCFEKHTKEITNVSDLPF